MREELRPTHAEGADHLLAVAHTAWKPPRTATSLPGCIGAQARIAAESVQAIQERYQGGDDPTFRERAIQIKEQRADLVKHHLWVLWTDCFEPPHFEQCPELHERRRPEAGPAVPRVPRGLAVRTLRSDMGRIVLSGH